MPNHDNTRRELLRIAGATTFLGLGGTATAAESSESLPDSTDDELSYDIVVLNNSGQPADVSVSVYEGTDAGEKRNENAVLSRKNRLGSASMREGRLGLSKGTYVIEVTRGDSTATTTWRVPAGGIPKWNALAVSLTPSGRIKLQEEEV